ncbi:uncharacterized protein LOC131648692 [Vicia villosa]|uniref:uncharacterized protein LOC131648692 n=1 Tax=Vicia villosa TaxID=3911 RepID=UPI00273AFE5B|nr:uncharacterized protein LOC131648692 [Vicia villosa]
MARPFESAKDITGKKELWKIDVRVECLTLQGTNIQDIIPAFYKGDFESALAPNNTYTISNFQVQNNDMLFKASDHGYLLKFIGGTKVFYANKNTIGDGSINFKPFADIISRKWKIDRLIGYTQSQCGSKKQQVNVILKDLCNDPINCTLWESYAVKFLQFYEGRKDMDLVIIVLILYVLHLEKHEFLSLRNMVKWQPKWKTMSVVSIIPNDMTVKKFLSKLEEAKPSSTDVNDTNSHQLNDPNPSNVNDPNLFHVNDPSSFQFTAFFFKYSAPYIEKHKRDIGEDFLHK